MRAAAVKRRCRVNAIAVRTMVSAVMIIHIPVTTVVAVVGVHADCAIVIARIADRRMRAVIAVKIISRMSRIIVRVPGTIIGVVIIRTDARIVVIPGCRPVMTMRSLNITPSVAHIERMLPHIIIRVEIDVRHVVARIADEHIASIVDHIEIIRIRRIAVRVRAADRAPVRIPVNIVHRVRTVIGHRSNRSRAARVINV